MQVSANINNDMTVKWAKLYQGPHKSVSFISPIAGIKTAFGLNNSSPTHQMWTVETCYWPPASTRCHLQSLLSYRKQPTTV